MDPASAFALACGIIQVVQASYGLFSLAKQVYRKGSLDSVDDLKKQISHFENICSTMNSRRPPQIALNTEEQEYAQLLKLTKDCDATAQELLDEVRKLEASGSHKIIEAVKTSARAISKSSTMQRLKNRMESYQEILRTRIFVDLWAKVQDLKTDQRGNLERLDKSLQTILNSFVLGEQSFDRLQDLISAEDSLTREHIDRYVVQQEQQRREQQLLDSLYFPDLVRGQKKVVDAHQETCQWIFDTSGQKLRPWSNFVEWLEHGSGTYWINGKAGSGKSTLMNFVWHNHQTFNHLRTWAGDKSLITPIFFFNVTGTGLQTSVEGLLRSIMYQILNIHRHLIRHVADWISAVPSGVRPDLVWTEGKLRQCFKSLIGVITPLFHVCLFIDGLDECHGDHRELLRLVSDFSGNSYFKICFSSRPERPFEEFMPSCSLRLQDLTHDDICKYVEAKMDEILQIRALSKSHLAWQQTVRNMIIGKAQGVFLWVELASKSQINGIHDADDLQTLERKLGSLPKDVEQLYSRMLGNIDGYQVEAARYLQTAFHFSERTRIGKLVGQNFDNLLDYAIARFGLTDSLRLSSQLTPANMESRILEISQRIPVTCAGLLEIYECRSDEVLPESALVPMEKFRGSLRVEKSSGVVEKSSGVISWKCIRWIHRSALDFFDPQATGGKFLEHHSSWPEFLDLLGSAICLARMKLYNLDNEFGVPQYLSYQSSRLLTVAHLAKPYTKSHIERSVDLLQYFDKVFEKLYKDDPRLPGPSYWCQRWLFYPPGAGIEVLLSGPAEYHYANVNKMDGPTNLLDLAALWHVDWYLRETFERESLGVERATQAAMWRTLLARYEYRLLQNSKRSFYWKVRDREGIEILMFLIRHGANPNCGILTSIWEVALLRMYQVKFCCDSRWRLADVRIQTKITNDFIVETTKYFLDAGGYEERTLYADLRDFSAARPSHCWIGFEINTSRLPITEALGESRLQRLGQQLKSREAQPTTLTRRPLRLVFRKIVDANHFWYSDNWIKDNYSRDSVDGLNGSKRSCDDRPDDDPISKKDDDQSDKIPDLANIGIADSIEEALRDRNDVKNRDTSSSYPSHGKEEVSHLYSGDVATTNAFSIHNFENDRRLTHFYEMSDQEMKEMEDILRAIMDSRRIRRIRELWKELWLWVGDKHKRLDATHDEKIWQRDVEMMFSKKSYDESENEDSDYDD